MIIGSRIDNEPHATRFVITSHGAHQPETIVWERRVNIGRFGPRWLRVLLHLRKLWETGLEQDRVVDEMMKDGYGA